MPNSNSLQLVKSGFTAYDLAMQTAETGQFLEDVVHQSLSGKTVDYNQIIEAGRLLPPLLHPDSAHSMVSGTGLNHLGSALARDAMHSKNGTSNQAAATDSMKMFQTRSRGRQAARRNFRRAAGMVLQGRWLLDCTAGAPAEASLFCTGWRGGSGTRGTLCN